MTVKLYRNKETGLIFLSTEEDVFGNYFGVVLNSGNTDIAIGTGLGSINPKLIWDNVFDISNCEVFDGIVEISNEKFAS